MCKNTAVDYNCHLFHWQLNSLKKHQIIGDVVDDFTPTVLVTAKYPSGVNVSLGNTLQPSHTQETPRVQIQGVNDSDVYTLVKETNC